MSRLDNWQNNLSSLIEQKRNIPFDFPTWNCLMWAGKGIEAVSGNNPVVHHNGKYKTEKAAATFLRKTDKVNTTQALLEKHLKTKAQPIAFARMGDIVLVNPDTIELDLPADIKLFGPVPGVCYGSISFFLGEDGLVEVNTFLLGQAIWVS